MDLSQPASGPNEMADEMAEVINEFLVESNEGLDRFDRDLIALEKDKTSRELLDSIFRAIHTIKGTGGVLGYEQLVSVSHLGESVLSRMRDGLLVPTPEIATALLVMADSLRRMLESIAAAGNEGDEDNSAVLEQLSAVLQQKEPSAPKPLIDAAKPSPGCDAVPLSGETLPDPQSCQSEEPDTATGFESEGAAAQARSWSTKAVPARMRWPKE